MSKAELQVRIAEVEMKLDSTVDYLDRGPVKDAIRLVIPMMKDVTELLKDIVEEMDGLSEEVRSRIGDTQ